MTPKREAELQAQGFQKKRFGWRKKTKHGEGQYNEMLKSLTLVGKIEYIGKIFKGSYLPIYR